MGRLAGVMRERVGQGPVDGQAAVGVVKEFGTGASYLGRGLRIVVSRPKLLVLGAIPAFIVFSALVAGYVALGYWIEDLSLTVTPFADDWSESWRTATRVTAGVLMFGMALLLGVVFFTSLTLLVGGPFYEFIAEQVEDMVGGVPGAVSYSWWRAFVRGVRDSVLLLAVSLVLTLPLFCAGFIPLVGQTVVPALAASVGGWILALELVGVPFQRRGLRLADRQRALRKRRALTLGLGVPVYFLNAIPFLAVVVMPSAVAAGVLLAREVLGVPTTAPVASASTKGRVLDA